VLSAEIEHLENTLSIDRNKVTFELDISNLIMYASDAPHGVRLIKLIDQPPFKIEMLDRLQIAIGLPLNYLYLGELFKPNLEAMFDNFLDCLMFSVSALFFDEPCRITFRAKFRTLYDGNSEINKGDVVLFDKNESTTYIGLVNDIEDDNLRLTHHDGDAYDNFLINRDYILGRLKPLRHFPIKYLKDNIPVLVADENQPLLGFVKLENGNIGLYSDGRLTKKIKDLSVKDHELGQYDICVLGVKDRHEQLLDFYDV